MVAVPEGMAAYYFEGVALMRKEYIDWVTVEQLIDKLLSILPRDYDIVMAITRGGMIPACLLSYRGRLRTMMVAVEHPASDVDELFAKPESCPVGKEPVTCKAECMDSLERLFIDHGDNIAACIFEPMLQGAAGMRIYPVKVLQRIFSLCTSYKILTIADEVATGFGRTGKLFACEHVGETPDIMCLAKGLTGGFAPMGITVVQEHIFEEFKGGFGSERILYHGHSFTGNPLAASAACASMELIKELAIPASFAPLIEYFNRGLHDFWKYDRVGDIRSIGLIGAIELVQDRNTKEPFPVSDRVAFRVAKAALSHGLLIRPLGDVIYFIPAFIITKEQIDEMFAALHHSLQEIIGSDHSPL